ncbi:rubrerythrin family protein [Geomonas sp. RF6]|uniref:rubrerythrin family protein n=1 Tax=Geomonas sp. RF6 TaxID=2897342 RepID=UPI001E450F42|nr:rubrerythrin family protein [Geomonas sp. RF6]UFS70750.1 rubrerythrin family protein [Geomonas sp. RF6]
MFIRTERNILKAYKGEARSKGAYLLFARQAESEGHYQVARLFRAAAFSEGVHAQWLLRSLRETSQMTNAAWEGQRCVLAVRNGDTVENLKNAIGGETIEFVSMFPEMIRDAAQEGWEFAHECFTCLNLVELVHVGLFSSALERIGRNPPAPYYVCESCGNVLEGKPGDLCTICEAPPVLFQLVD